MYKRFIMMLMFMVSMIAMANETVEIEKEVTGVDRQTLEQADEVENVNILQDGELKDVDVRIKSNDLKTQNETLTVEAEKTDDGLEKELSKGMSEDKSWLKYILGGLLLLVGIVAI